MEQPIRFRSLRNKLSNIGRGWRCVRLSGRPPLKQVGPTLRGANRPQRTPETGTEFFLAELLDVKAELPYTTVVEGLEEFHYQSELQPRV